MKYNHAMAEREYKREWKVAKLEMRKAGMQRKQIREAARAYRLEFNGERRFYRRTDVVPVCEREDRPPKGVDTLFQESHSMHSPDLEDDIGELIDQVERSDLLSWLRSLTEQQYRVVELYTEGYATSDIAQILSLDMGIFMMGTLVGALTFGLLSDKIGAQITTILALVCGGAAILTLILGGRYPVLFNAAALVFGFACASVGTLGPLLTTAIFGQKDYSRIYSSIAMGMAFAGMVSMSGYGFIYDAFHSYVPVLWAICAMLLICMVCVLTAFTDKKRRAA